MMTATLIDPAKLAQICQAKARLTEARNILANLTDLPTDTDAEQLITETCNSTAEAVDAAGRLVDHLAG